MIIIISCWYDSWYRSHASPTREDQRKGLMARTRQLTEPSKIVNFDFEKRTYQIDPVGKRVYRRFVEIETSKAAQILSLWRARHATA